jgi:NH3-dependent NAD+ synthetase
MKSFPTELAIDPAAETERLVSFLRQTVRKIMHRSGGVVGISGGIDSSVALALCIRAFGKGFSSCYIHAERTRSRERDVRTLGC